MEVRAGAEADEEEEDNEPVVRAEENTKVCKVSVRKTSRLKRTVSSNLLGQGSGGQGYQRQGGDERGPGGGEFRGGDRGRGGRGFGGQSINRGLSKKLQLLN